MAVRARTIAAALLVMATLVACGAASASLVGRSWELVAVGGKPPVAEGSITFAEDGTVAYRTGCNSGGGSYAVEATHLRFDAGFMTEMACDEPRGAQEAAFAAVLASNPPFVVNGAQLTLGTGAQSLTFQAG
jgi:heat shock protein HslJ